MIDDVQSYVPLAGFAAAVVIWLRQYWLQQKLTNEQLERLRLDNEVLRKENRRVTRENTILRTHAPAAALKMLDNIEHD